MVSVEAPDESGEVVTLYFDGNPVSFDINDLAVALALFLNPNASTTQIQQVALDIFGLSLTNSQIVGAGPNPLANFDFNGDGIRGDIQDLGVAVAVFLGATTPDAVNAICQDLLGQTCEVATSTALPGPGATPFPGSVSPTPLPSPSPTPTPLPTGSPGNVSLLSDIKYGEGATATGSVDLLLDIYQPEATCTTPRPTIFYVHGGAFILGDKSDQIVAALAPPIVAEGFNFVSINYRLSGDQPVFSQEYAAFAQALVNDGLADPENDVFDAVISSIEDGVTALRWMDANADEYCLDMDRMGYWGSSAGTIITAQIAYGLNQFGIARPEPRFLNAWWGELFRIEDLEVGEAPFLILHGNEDPLVDYQVSLDLTAQADVVGVPYAFYTLVGTGHGFDTSNQAQTAASIQASIDFAAAQLTDGSPSYGRFNLP